MFIPEAKRISEPEFCGFVWKQGAADGTRKELAEAYYERLNQLIPKVNTLYPGKLPIGDNGTHYSSEGYIKLGKITATAVEDFYKVNH